MKKLLTILCLLLGLCANARNIYVSSSDGNDSDNGTTQGLAYRTIGKVNAIFSSLSPGDSVLFKRGDTFLGQFFLSRSGLSGQPIIISAYGTGSKPIISGLVLLHNWTSVGTNLYECTPDSTMKATCNVLTINGFPKDVGRTPNIGSYYAYSSATATQLNTSLTGSPSYVGAEVVLKYKSYVISKKTITAQSGGTLTIANGQFIDDGRGVNPSSGSNYGFFLQRFQNSLDANGEWYFNKGTNKMRIYSTVNPSTLIIKASFKDTVVNSNSSKYITFDNLQIEGASIYGIESYNSSNITIQNCTFLNNTRAIYLWNPIHPTVQYNYIRNSFNNAILISANSGTPASQVDCNYNYVDSTGMLMGMAPFNSDANMKGIVCRTGPGTVGQYNNIIGNVVRHVGHMGIQFQGSNVIVRRNWTDSLCERIQDGGGIYTFDLNTAVTTDNYVNRVVDSNFVSNAIGGGWGVGSDNNVDVCAIYMDDQTMNVTIKNNTAWNIPGNGVQMNTPKNITITDNTFYNCLYAFNLNQRQFGRVSNVKASRNIIYQKDATQYNFYTVNDTTNPQSQSQWLQSMIVTDSNWITNLKSSSYNATTKPSVIPSSSYTVTIFNLAAWQSTYGHDVHAVLPPVTVTTTNTRIVFNPSDTVTRPGFVGFRKVSPNNVFYNNYITLQPWTSAVLIDNGTANIPPVSNAGADQSTTIPRDSVTLSGSATDADGTISSYIWLKVYGPSGGTVVSPTSASTKIRTLQPGVYQFSLTATDNGGVTNADTVQVTVIANTPPTAGAGADQVLTLPTNNTSIFGSASDIDGTISSYNWAVISGPNTPTMPTPNAISTGVNGMIQGVYFIKFTVTDNGGLIGRDTVQITVNAAANQAPTANAGTDFSITLPTNTGTLSGSGSDADGTVTGYAWLQILGPNTATMGTPNAANTTIGNLVQGVYGFQLIVTDNNGATGKDTVSLVVNAAANQTPMATAGGTQTIVAPVSSVTLSGSGNDPDGSITAYHWDKISGPSGDAIVNANNATTVVNGLTPGTYVYQLTVTDNFTPGATGTAQVTIIVSPNPPPTANAGSDIVITQPANSTTLTGSGTDNVSISSYGWVKISGPSGGTIANASSVSTAINSLQAGVYQYELTVTDNGSATGKDTVQVTVNLAANVLPTANAGADRSFDPPRDTITLFGSGADSDGSIASYQWTKLLGPSSVINNPNSATTVISALVTGTYQFELTVTDNRGGIAKDTIQLVVTDQPANIPPLVHTPHPAVRITLPTDSVTLVGVASDPDGMIAAYEWTGNGGTIVSQNSATTVIRNLVPGTYTFTLTVMDNRNATAFDVTTVVVSEAPKKRILLGIVTKKL